MVATAAADLDAVQWEPFDGQTLHPPSTERVGSINPPGERVGSVNPPRERVSSANPRVCGSASSERYGDDSSQGYGNVGRIHARTNASALPSGTRKEVTLDYRAKAEVSGWNHGSKTAVDNRLNEMHARQEWWAAQETSQTSNTSLPQRDTVSRTQLRSLPCVCLSNACVFVRVRPLRDLSLHRPLS